MMKVSTSAGEIQRKTLATSCIRTVEKRFMSLAVILAGRNITQIGGCKTVFQPSAASAAARPRGSRPR